MTTPEHLSKIKEKCEKLLENASKRTQGEWYSAQGSVAVFPATEKGFVIADVYLSGIENSSFIASCAGPAELGWLNTIARIDFLEKLRRMYPKKVNDMLYALIELEEAEIIELWPEKLL